jgi:hypothetical protein
MYHVKESNIFTKLILSVRLCKQQTNRQTIPLEVLNQFFYLMFIAHASIHTFHTRTQTPFYLPTTLSLSFSLFLSLSLSFSRNMTLILTCLFLTHFHCTKSWKNVLFVSIRISYLTSCGLFLFKLSILETHKNPML